LYVSLGYEKIITHIMRLSVEGNLLRRYTRWKEQGMDSFVVFRRQGCHDFCTDRPELEGLEILAAVKERCT
jgi:hypothetical protein